MPSEIAARRLAAARSSTSCPARVKRCERATRSGRPRRCSAVASVHGVAPGQPVSIESQGGIANRAVRLWRSFFCTLRAIRDRSGLPRDRRKLIVAGSTPTGPHRDESWGRRGVEVGPTAAPAAASPTGACRPSVAPRSTRSARSGLSGRPGRAGVLDGIPGALGSRIGWHWCLVQDSVHTGPCPLDGVMNPLQALAGGVVVAADRCQP
jgi:hypothetical protein